MALHASTPVPALLFLRRLTLRPPFLQVLNMHLLLFQCSVRAGAVQAMEALPPRTGEASEAQEVKTPQGHSQ